MVVLGLIAWGSLGVFLMAAALGAALLDRAYRPALLVLCAATVAGSVFSFLTGFSIGRFTSVLPVVLTAFAVTHGRRTILQLAALAIAFAIYYALAWIFPEKVGFWGIYIELMLCAAAYGIAFVLAPRIPSAAGPTGA